MNVAYITPLFGKLFLKNHFRNIKKFRCYICISSMLLSSPYFYNKHESADVNG